MRAGEGVGRRAGSSGGAALSSRDSRKSARRRGSLAQELEHARQILVADLAGTQRELAQDLAQALLELLARLAVGAVHDIRIDVPLAGDRADRQAGGEPQLQELDAPALLGRAAL